MHSAASVAMRARGCIVGGITIEVVEATFLQEVPLRQACYRLGSGLPPTDIRCRRRVRPPQRCNYCCSLAFRVNPHHAGFVGADAATWEFLRFHFSCITCAHTRPSELVLSLLQLLTQPLYFTTACIL